MIQEPLAKQRDGASETDALQMWADIDAHLHFADQIIQKSDLPTQLRTALLERVERIRVRRADPNMYLAVVGEFTTGKSTFINALLHEELLKSSVDVTTAAATRLCYGSQTDLEVRFQNSEKPLSYTRDRATLVRNIQTFSRTLQGNTQDIRTAINAVTADNDVASKVERVVIRHPAPFLTNGIVVIDTPGINAEHAAHAQIANAVVQHEADAAVVIIPAPVPLAQTLTAFLTEHLRPFIHRCLFVVTQMDKIQEREQKRLLENIQMRLTKALGIEQPIVLYEAAPQVVLDTLQKHTVAPALQHWYGKFGELEQTLWDRLRQERALSITESLLRLMTALFEEVGMRLRERQASYEMRQAAIQRETIQDISSFTAQQQQAYQTILASAVATAHGKIVAYIDKQREETQAGIRSAIFGVDSASELKSLTEDTIKPLMEYAGRSFQEELQKRVQKLEKAAAKASLSFDTCFAQEYQKLRVLAGTVSVGDAVSSSYNVEVTTSSIAYSADKINEELDGATNKLGWGGAAVGAAIGTAILPGIGTVAGIFVGPLLVGLFGPSLDDRKTKLWDGVYPAISSSFETMRRQAYEALNTYEREVQFAFNQRIGVYSTIDVAMFVIACDFPVATSEQEAIGIIKEANHETVFFVCNRFNMITKPEDRKRVKERCLSILAPLTKQGAKHVFFIDALGALQGRLQDNGFQVEQSNLPSLEEELRDFLVNERGRVKLMRPANGLKGAIREARIAIPQQQRMFQMDMDMLQTRYVEAKQGLDALGQERRDIISYMEGARMRLSSEISNSAARFYADAAHQVEGWLRAYSVQKPMGLHEVLSSKARERVVAEVVAFLVAQVGTTFKEWQQSTLEPMIARHMSEMERVLGEKTQHFVVGIDEVRASLTANIALGISVSDAQKEQVSGKERLAAGALGAGLGFILGDPGLAIMGGMFGFKEMLKNILPQIAVMVATSLILGPAFIIPAVLGAALVKGLINANTITKKIRDAVGQEYKKKLVDHRRKDSWAGQSR